MLPRAMLRQKMLPQTMLPQTMLQKEGKDPPALVWVQFAPELNIEMASVGE
jgi:hypothetical protein